MTSETSIFNLSSMVKDVTNETFHHLVSQSSDPSNAEIAEAIRTCSTFTHGTKDLIQQLVHHIYALKKQVAIANAVTSSSQKVSTGPIPFCWLVAFCKKLKK